MIMGYIGGILAIIGSLFLLLAAIGLIRMPDTYNRMQAGTKATTLGSALIFAGIALHQPGWELKMAALIIFVFLTNPLSSHALARAAHFIGMNPFVKGKSQSSRDDLKARRDEE